MSKSTSNIDSIVQTLQEAQQNKDLLNAIVSNLEKFVDNQRSVLNDLEALIGNAKDGNIPAVKKGKGGRKKGSKNKSEEGNEVEND